MFLLFFLLFGYKTIKLYFIFLNDKIINKKLNRRKKNEIQKKRFLVFVTLYLHTD